jgi:hypothetical protein
LERGEPNAAQDVTWKQRLTGDSDQEPEIE